MKKPSLEEVREYFKNAEYVESLGDIIKVDLSRIFFRDELYWATFNTGCYIIWDDENGYAKILTYKNPEFRPIAMKCTQDQFENILPRLEGKIKFETLYKDFEGEYNYLTNFYNNQNNSLGFRNKFLFSNEEIIEKWDEKVFLEACGIEVEEEETFVITKEQIITLNTDGNKDVRKCMREWFPSAFVEDKKELPKCFTGWCKIDNMGNDDWIMYFEDDIQQYGIDSNEDWFVPAGVAKIKSYYREATESEVFEALKKEAVKRGFVNGVCINNSNLNDEDFGQGNVITGEINIQKSDLTVWSESTEGYERQLFRKGKWAEIIPTITKEEAEKLLNKKII